ncbi:uncharacterized protein LOC34622936 [Cyclospora cayetanensis]|uniref:Uncharacterized protein LOC34622936 n=1 Tax=Cyclospora cayetanensis TaxID=88456 RepID=A0A6P6S411_9EIME|nr:uncharacterized protein LOC34622936 [Cyclospora cayetanensis]
MRSTDSNATQTARVKELPLQSVIQNMHGYGVAKCRALLLKQKFFKLHERYAHAASKESYAAARLQRLQGQLTHQQEELAEAATKAAQYAERIASLKHEINEKKADVVRSSSRQHMLHQQLAALKAEAQELQGQLETQVKRSANSNARFPFERSLKGFPA